jgi:hypothetical protein
MKKPATLTTFFLTLRRLLPSLFLVWSLLPCFSASAITLTGSNGRAVEFYSIKSATPKGITAQMVADGPVLGIPWEKLDLEALETDQKAIWEAYLRTKEGETIELSLEGAMADKPSDAPADAPADPASPSSPQQKYMGWMDTKVGAVEFMLQMPAAKPRGVLVLSLDDFGDAFRYVMGHEKGSGVWSDFQNKHDLALLSYDLGTGKQDYTKLDDFTFAQKGSGKTLLTAMKNFATKLKEPGFADLPIALYGAGRTGAGFVYNFVQTHPERVLAAAVSKGAFYDAEPTEASVKVPMLFVWGQYCTNHELWQSENSAEPILAKYASMKPNWTNGREVRGRDEQNLLVEHMAKQYLLAMIPERMPEAKPEPAPAPAPDPAVTPAAGTPAAPAEGAAAAETKPEPPPAPEVPEPVELDRSKGSVGNIKTGEVVKITDPSAELGPDETFIPNGDVAKVWKPYVLGELEPPAPK